PKKGRPHHEWLIEFDKDPESLINFANEIDKNMQKINSYYFDLVKGDILDSLKIRVIEKGGFVQHMKSVGKLGGQNKVPRLSNDRSVADNLLKYENKG
ncbi:GH3 auxin-responsive promoter family protein, partial [Bacteroidota bacterium]|nr:GH3 auxin-responsive promoter family protein [Bacteroidota bacterium]